MSVVVRALMVLILTLLVGCGFDCIASAEDSLLMIKQPASDASLVSSQKDGMLQFRISGKTRKVALKQLVRWKISPTAKRHSEVILVDGSRLVLAEVWTGEPAWKTQGDMLIATTKLFGEIKLPCSQIRAILLNTSKMLRHWPQVLDQQVEKNDLRDKSTSQKVCFLNGDRWEGEFDRIAKNDAGEWRIFWSADSASEPLQLPMNQVTAIVLGNSLPRSAAKARLVVGLRDGSVLWAESLVTDAQSLQIRLVNGVELRGADRREVAHLRSLESECVYLSDLEPAGYRHLPYLEIRWPYQLNHNVLAKPLRAQGRIYDKGIGMPTAARLSYRLNVPGSDRRFQRFAAAVAVDDAAGRGGSVVFRVYLEQAGDWQLAFESPLVRGNDVPLSVSIDLGVATQLALVTDFAERGDELDYANWLDARLE